MNNNILCLFLVLITVGIVPACKNKGEIKNNSVEHRFNLNDSAMPCKFTFSGNLTENSPEWIKNYIAAVMYSDLNIIFNDLGNEGDYMKEYEKQNLNSKRYLGLNSADASPKEIAEYFAKRFERLYKKKFANEDGLAPTYEYLMDVTPVWTSDDGKLSTYKFYTYNYGGGAHGMMYEYYLTFDTRTGSILGYKDLFGDDEFQEALVQLSIQINQKLLNDDTRTNLTADVGRSEQDDSPKGIWYEICNGYVYPRPALVEDGVMFSYQPYDKASFAEGILHFVVPNSK